MVVYKGITPSPVPSSNTESLDATYEEANHSFIEKKAGITAEAYPETDGEKIHQQTHWKNTGVDISGSFNYVIRRPFTGCIFLLHQICTIHVQSGTHGRIKDNLRSNHGQGRVLQALSSHRCIHWAMGKRWHVCTRNIL